MNERVFLKYIEKISPDMENDRITKATNIFFNCIKYKYDIIAELDKEFLEIEKELPFTVAKRFQRMFYKDFAERTKYELKGSYIIDGNEKAIDDDCFPYLFEKGSIKAKLEKTDKIPNDTLFSELMLMFTGKVTEEDNLILYEVYAGDMNWILNKILNTYLEKVIAKYAKDILRHPYDQYEDIKEVVNRAVLDHIGYLSLFHFLEGIGEFVGYVGWEDKTINDILTIAKS